jgi:hypothetical protein
VVTGQSFAGIATRLGKAAAVVAAAEDAVADATRLLSFLSDRTFRFWQP